MTDLDKLIAAVEAGDEQAPGFAGRVFGDTLQTGDAVDVLVNGSLDAALRLHEALLPGWKWVLRPLGFGASATVWADETRAAEALQDNPARAWLLAILRALKAKGDA